MKKKAPSPTTPHPIEQAIVRRDEFGLFVEAFGIVARPAWQSRILAGEEVGCRHLDGTDILGLGPMDEARERFAEVWTIANDAAVLDRLSGRWLFADGDSNLAWSSFTSPKHLSPFVANCISVALMSLCFPRMANDGSGHRLSELASHIKAFWKTDPMAAHRHDHGSALFTQGLGLIASRGLRDEIDKAIGPMPAEAPKAPAQRL